MLKKLLRRNKTEEDSGPLKITNETLEEARKEVIKGAKKFVLPIQHSKHRVVLMSSLIGALIIIGFLTFCMVSLYKLKSTSTLIYRVTQVIPFPAARVDGQFVSYEDYLFEIRQYIHYYETQEKVDFSSSDGVVQLEAERKVALQKVVDQAYIRIMAKRLGITVSSDEVDSEVELLESQNRLGGNEQALKDVIKNYYGWTINDFRRSLQDRILYSKVLEALDTDATTRAQAALAELNSGKDFAKVAAKYSDDTNTKDKGGEIDFLIDKSDRNLPSQMTSALYALKPGEYSGVVNVGYGLEIVKNIEEKDGKIQGAYILFNFKDMNVFLNAEKETHKSSVYIKL